MKVSSRTWILGIMACALVFRLAFWIGVVGLHGPLRGDEINYQDHAADLAAGRGFVGADGHPSAARPPLLPIVLGGLYRVFGTHIEVGRAFGVLLGVAIVGLTYLLALRIFPRAVAIAAAGLAAVNPYLVFISSYLLTENLYTVLLLGMLIMLDVGRSRHFARWKDPVAAGLFLGLASLARANGAALGVLAIPAVLVMASGTLPRRIAACAILAAAALAVMTPWAARNHAKLGAWVFFTTHGGITFYQSNNQLVWEDPALRGSVAPREALPGWDRLKDAGEIEGDREAWELGMAFLREHPRAIPSLITWRFLRFWRFRSHAAWSGVKSGWWWNKSMFLGNLASRFDFGILYSIVVIPGFIVGLVATRRDWSKVYLLYATVAIHTLVALAFYGSLRARTPIEPVVAIMAAAGLAYVVSRVRCRLRFSERGASNP
jgi:4-amino-4-deoxy-L-arabinose transferase-like glycosyltransferase